MERVTWQTSQANLETPLAAWPEPRVNGTACPHPVVRRLLPTRNGKLRPRGLPALEAPIVAQAVARRLAAIDEQDGGDGSYGCRPGRRPHQARPEVRQGWLKNGMGSVLDGASSACVDHLQHERLWAILRKRVNDGRVLEDIELWRQADILDGKEMVCAEQGSPPGSVLSPLWANGYLHEVLDPRWETVVQAHCRGKVVLSRDADDWVIGCERAEAARRMRQGWPQRFAK